MKFHRFATAVVLFSIMTCMKTYEYSFQVKNSTQYRLFGVDIQWSTSGKGSPIDLDTGETSAVFTISKELLAYNCSPDPDAVSYRLDSAKNADTTLRSIEHGYQVFDGSELRTGGVNFVDIYSVSTITHPRYRLNGE